MTKNSRKVRVLKINKKPKSKGWKIIIKIPSLAKKVRLIINTKKVRII